DELDFARASLLLVRRNPLGAQRLLEPITSTSGLVRRHHLLAITYERLGRWKDAAIEFETVLSRRYRNVLVAADWELDRFHLAQVYERLGDANRACSWYRRFADDWKDGDQNIPELQTARARLAAPDRCQGEGK